MHWWGVSPDDFQLFLHRCANESKIEELDITPTTHIVLSKTIETMPWSIDVVDKLTIISAGTE